MKFEENISLLAGLNRF